SCPSLSSAAIWRTPRSTPVPYTTLFRSENAGHNQHPERIQADGAHGVHFFVDFHHPQLGGKGTAGTAGYHDCREQHAHFPQYGRSEEHTSELQSRENLVCRLLLEKKNQK